MPGRAAALHWFEQQGGEHRVDVVTARGVDPQRGQEHPLEQPPEPQHLRVPLALRVDARQPAVVQRVRQVQRELQVLAVRVGGAHGRRQLRTRSQRCEQRRGQRPAGTRQNTRRDGGSRSHAVSLRHALPAQRPEDQHEDGQHCQHRQQALGDRETRRVEQVDRLGLLAGRPRRRRSRGVSRGN